MRGDWAAPGCAALSEIVRQSDFVGRYGGEEFLVLLPSTDVDGARVMGEKIRSVVGEIVIPTVQRKISVSIGIAVLPDHALDAETLAQAADRALYSAKSLGRDRVEVAVDGTGLFSGSTEQTDPKEHADDLIPD